MPARNRRCAGTIAKLVVVMVALQALAGCGTAAPPTATPFPTAVPTPTPVRPDYWPTKGWKVSTPEEQGIASEGLLGVMDRVETANINVRSITVIRNGYVVLEAYRQPFTPDQKVPVHSVTKSVIGTLTGIAIEEGKLKSVDEKVLSFFPDVEIENRDTRKDAMRVEDLLTMRPGLECGDDKLALGMEQSSDWVRYVLGLPMDADPGTKMIYCTAGVHLMSALLQKATTQTTKEYAQPRLFEPLGIEEEAIVWPADPQGVTLGGYGIEIKPLDLAKLGLLYLYDGSWDGRQLVPADWVAASTRAHAKGSDNKDYGYLMWVYPSHYAAEGYGEQKMMVVKEKELVVVITAAMNWKKGQVLEDLLRDYVLPAVQADEPLPDNPAAYKRLQEKVAYWDNPVKAPAPIRDVARAALGKTFTFEENGMGWKEITLDFKDGAAEGVATILETNGTTQATIGLDNVYRVMYNQNGWIAFRGGWVDETTLVVRQIQQYPDALEYEFRIEFVGDEVKVHAEETVFGGFTFDATGKAKK